MFVNGCVLFCGIGETVTIVGDQDPAMMKFFDCTRSGPRSAFDSNVVYQFEIMEYVWFLSLFFCFATSSILSELLLFIPLLYLVWLVKVFSLILQVL